MKTILLTLLIVSSSTSVFSAVIPQEWQNAIHQEVNINKNSYPVVRIKRSHATPVLLLHGLGGNAHNWMDVGSELYKAGYDVWAITWSARLDRNIEESGNKTVRELVSYVYNRTGKKLFLAGHSLGGIISKVYALGIDRHPLTGKIFVNKFLKLHSKKYVKGFVSISAPSGVDKRLSRFIPILKRIPNTAIPGQANLSTIINEGNLERDLLVVKAFELSSLGSRLPVIKQFTKIVFNTDYHSVADYSIGKLIRYGTAPMSKLITNQIGSKEYRSNDAAKMSNIFRSEGDHIPFSFIAGESDDIASSDIIRQEAQSQNSELLFLPKAGHMDALSGDLVTDTVHFMLNFFRRAAKE